MSFINRNLMILHIHAYSFSNTLISLIPSGASDYTLHCVKIKYWVERSPIYP
jgi:hypothetical protein